LLIFILTFRIMYVYFLLLIFCVCAAHLYSNSGKKRRHTSEADNICVFASDCAKLMSIHWTAFFMLVFMFCLGKKKKVTERKCNIRFNTYMTIYLQYYTNL